MRDGGYLWLGFYMGFAVGGLVAGAIMTWVMQKRFQRLEQAERERVQHRYGPVLTTVYLPNGESRRKIAPEVVDHAIKASNTQRRRPVVPFAVEPPPAHS